MATKTKSATKVGIPQLSTADARQLVAERVAELKVQMTALKAELSPLEEILREAPGSEWQTDHGVVAAVPVESVSVDADAVREIVGTRKFNSDFRSDKVDLNKWKANGPDLALVHNVAPSAVSAVTVNVRISGPKVRKV